MNVFLLTPPFTQLNTPYPATAYLKGFLNTKNISSIQADIGMEVIIKLFSKVGLNFLFDQEHLIKGNFSDNAHRIYTLRQDYISTISSVIAFLQDKDPSLAYLICTGNYLPEAGRFEQMADLEFAFGNMGIRDKARHLATLYLEDISDFIIETTDRFFGFSRYAERLGRSANTFDELLGHLNAPPSFIDQLLFEVLDNHIKSDDLPELVAISVPFPGNLYSAFRSAQWCKQKFTDIKICMGGGFPNTELRSISDARVFDFFDFITLDDGEAPLEHLIQHLQGNRTIDFLKRTFARVDGKVSFYNGSGAPDYKQKDIGTPDYSGLELKNYLSVIEVTNPMHRLWSDGRWNKLTLAHGCYWGKCTFCDITLDYIGNYEFTTAKMLVDRMEIVIQQTGQQGFHFVDEAAPPALMKEVALEILRRNLTVTWWTNIRFEKSFSRDLCRLLALAGCIAVSGGLEVASDRLLKLIDKGVTVAQVARVSDNFTHSGIMVHAYLMYGFPTQNEQETVDSLEMVRQMFEAGIIQSGFWHQFALTAHSPVGKKPTDYGLRLITTQQGNFANNDLEYEDLTGCEHELFSAGLKKSLFNYMNGICFEYNLQEWFDFEIPETSVSETYIQDVLNIDEPDKITESKRVIYMGVIPEIQRIKANMINLLFTTKSESLEIQLDKKSGLWILKMLEETSLVKENNVTYADLVLDFQKEELGDLSLFWLREEMDLIKQCGLLIV